MEQGCSDGPAEVARAGKNGALPTKSEGGGPAEDGGGGPE